jgi:hypothetical protein
VKAEGYAQVREPDRSIVNAFAMPGRACPLRIFFDWLSNRNVFRQRPKRDPVEAPWVPCSRPVALKIAGCDFDDSLDHPSLSKNTLFQDGETLGNL